MIAMKKDIAAMRNGRTRCLREASSQPFVSGILLESRAYTLLYGAYSTVFAHDRRLMSYRVGGDDRDGGCWLNSWKGPMDGNRLAARPHMNKKACLKAHSYRMTPEDNDLLNPVCGVSRCCRRSGVPMMHITMLTTLRSS